MEHIKARIKMEMSIFTTANGIMISKKEKANTNIQIKIFTTAIGKTIKDMEAAFMISQQEKEYAANG